MKAYGRSWDYNVYDCRYCLYWKGRKKGCVYPDGCCCPVDQRDAVQFRDDENFGDSVSIETQRTILRQFAKENNLRVYDEYIDAPVIIGLTN